MLRPRPLGALLAALIGLPSAATAQMAALDSYLMRPQLDGDPRRSPRFSRTTRPQLSEQGFISRPAWGAGTTGFVSASLRRPTAQPGRLAQVAALPKESAIGPLGPPPLRAAENVAQNPKQGVKQNLTQQPHTATSANAAYPVGPVGDPPMLPARRRLLPDEDFFAPTGFHVGGLVLRPAMEATVGYDSNPARSATGNASWFAVMAPERRTSSSFTTTTGEPTGATGLKYIKINHEFAVADRTPLKATINRGDNAGVNFEVK